MNRYFPFIEFSNLVTSSDNNRQLIDKIYAQIDQEFSENFNDFVQNKLTLTEFRQKIVDKLQDEVFKQELDYPVDFESINNWIIKYFDIIVSSEKLKHSLKKSQLARNLARESFHKISVSTKDIAELKSLIYEDDFNRLRSKFHPTNRITVESFKLDSIVHSKIKKILRKHSVLKDIGEYYSQRVKVVYSVLIFNNDQEKWYVDEDGQTGPFQYLHVDEDPNVIKLMFYLSDVGSDSGPFTYVPRNGEARVCFKSICARAMDRFCEKTSTKKSVYYLARYRLNAYSYLPNQLKCITHMGDELNHENFKREEVQVLSKDTEAFCFDGASLLHRGGLVKKGERWAIQVAIQPCKLKDLILPDFVRIQLSKIKKAILK